MITNMDGMFDNCISLSEIPMIDTSNVTSAIGMFNGCTALTTVPLLDFSSLKRMDQMFANCTALISVPQFNTSNVTSMASTFSGCKKFTALPLLDVSKVETMSSMFRDCTALYEIPNLVTPSLTTSNEMFRNCTSLITIPSTIDLSKSTNVYAMFYGCTSLRSLPLLDLDSVRSTATNAALFLLDCGSLESCSFNNNRVSFDVSGLPNLTSVKFFNSYRGITLNVSYNTALTSEALNEMFEALSEVEKGTINISGCLGVYGCDPTIAEKKGWTVTIDYSLPHHLKKYTR